MNAKEHFQAGQLTAAVAAAVDEVKKHPADTSRRAFLCGMLCFSGDLDRADSHLDAVGNQDPSLAVGISLLRHLIRGEQARQQLYSEGRVPDFLSEPTPVLKLHLEATIRIREGKAHEAADLLEQAEAQRVHVKGTCDGVAFDDWRDLDDRTAAFCELLTSNGKYYWVPMERIELIEFRPPERWQDLIWRRAHILVTDGPDAEVYFPTLYAGSHTDEDDRIRLGRTTDWRGGNGSPVVGLGLRTWLLGDSDRTILEIQNITVTSPDAGA